MPAYYNEIDKYAAQWLRNLITRGLIAPGDVDERSIEDVSPDDLRGYTQCHFFAGIGVWSYGLRLAGVSDDTRVWTGSCPCQPFSTAGAGAGFTDERHLWPIWYELIGQCKPPIIFGEQVASSAVIGKTVQKMRTDQIVGILQSAQQRIQVGVQGLRECRSEDHKAMGDGREASVSIGAEIDSSRLCADERRETESAGEGAFVRSGLAQHSGEDRCGSLRGDRDSVRLEHGICVECPVAGSENSWCGLHEWEHESCALRTEHNGEHLGRGSDSEDRGCDSGETLIERIERIISEDGRAPDDENEPAWLDTVQHDLEKAHYTSGSCVVPACGFGGPHIRQRLFFVAEKLADSDLQRQSSLSCAGLQDQEHHPESCGGAGGGLADAKRHAGHGKVQCGLSEKDGEGPTDRTCGCRNADCRLDNTLRTGLEGHPGHGDDGDGPGWLDSAADRSIATPGCTNGFWRDADWLPFRDSKIRPVEPGTFPLADGTPSTVGRLRAYGNAIVAEVAKEFIQAYMTCRPA